MSTRRMTPWLVLLGLLSWSATTQAANPVGAYRFSELKSLSVENNQNEKLGKIEDLVYDSNTGEIRYAAISFGGFLGVGNKLFAVPWHALKVQSEPNNQRRFIHFAADRASLKAAPGFAHDQWPDVANPQWSNEVDKFYAESHPQEHHVAAKATMGARASNLVGLRVANEREETLGDVHDIVVDMHPGKIRYAALAVGGIAGIGDRLFAVPFDALRAMREPKNTNKFHIVLNADKEALKKAPGFDKENWPDFANSSWAMTNDRFYQRTMTAPATPGTAAFKSKDLVGLRVENAQRENLGKVDSLVVDLNTGKVRYAAVSFGGFLGLGSKLYAIPWEAFQIRYDSDREANAVVLNVDKQKLQQAQSFDSDHWPNFADETWSKEMHAFYGTTAVPMPTGNHHIRRTSDILGTRVTNGQNEKLGTIDEMVFDLPSGSVRYAAMSFGGFLGIGDKLFAVPWKSIQFRNEANSTKLEAVVQMDKKTLEKAPNFERARWPDFADPNWSRDIDQHYRDQAANR